MLTDNLQRAVEISLFSDRRAGADDQPPGGPDDKRGWWGDLLLPRPLGSRLWLLTERAKMVEGLEGEVEEAAQEALAWLVEAGVAKEVEVTAGRDGDRLYMTVAITRPDGGKYEQLWRVF